MKNALTFDLEEYFHVSAYSDRLRPEDWDSFPSRVSESMDWILEMLAIHDCRATFFVLGWLAQRRPEIVRRVSAAGHEIACHSFLHRRVFQMTQQEFREDTLQAKAIIEDIIGRKVVGYRAPSFSITRNSLWAFDALIEAGFQYDSSIYPVEHPSYGMPNAPRTPFCVKTDSGSILEFPMSALEFGGRRSPFAGGAYLRALPYFFTRWGVRYLNECEKRFACVYVHPWEIDPGQERLRGPLTSHLRHRLGLGGLKKKLRRLMGDFQFCPLGTLVRDPIPIVPVTSLVS